MKQHLVSSNSEAFPCCPVDNNEAQTHYHEGETQSGKAGSLRMMGKHFGLNYQEVVK